MELGLKYLPPCFSLQPQQREHQEQQHGAADQRPGEAQQVVRHRGDPAVRCAQPPQAPQVPLLQTLPADVLRGHGQVAPHLPQAQASAANRLIGEVVQSRRRPLLGPSPG